MSGSKGIKGNFTKIGKNTTSKKVNIDVNRSENLLFLSADGINEDSPKLSAKSARRDIEPDSARQRQSTKVNFGAGSFGGSGMKLG